MVNNNRSALIIGVTGMMGLNIAEKLLSEGWKVSGVSRTVQYETPGVNHILADVLNPEDLKSKLNNLDFDTLFYSTWKKHDTEQENCEVNGVMLQNTFDAIRGKKINQTVLITGLKHYLGPFSAYAATPMDTPFHETQERLMIPNFYYTQEDILFEEARKQNFTWTVLRPHSMIGFALGNVMNMGVTLAVYASICKENNSPFIFPGSREQYNGVVDITDGRLLADHAYWAATESKAHNEAFNSVNGDVMRWRQVWQVIADYFQLDNPGCPDQYTPLEPRMTDADQQWEKIVAKHSLKNFKAIELASWWHTDGDLGRQVETFADMGKSRRAGFKNVQVSFDSFTDLFDRLRREKVIP